MQVFKTAPWVLLALVALFFGVSWLLGANERATDQVLRDMLVRSELPVEPSSTSGYDVLRVGHENCDQFGFNIAGRSGAPMESAEFLAQSLESDGWEVARKISFGSEEGDPPDRFRVSAVSPDRFSEINATFRQSGMTVSANHSDGTCSFGNPESLGGIDDGLVDEFPLS